MDYTKHPTNLEDSSYYFANDFEVSSHSKEVDLFYGGI